MRVVTRAGTRGAVVPTRDFARFARGPSLVSFVIANSRLCEIMLSWGITDFIGRVISRS